MGVHLVFFLHLTTAPNNTNNAMALAFGVLIVALIIGGSLWIMDHLNQNMAPMHQMVQIQRWGWASPHCYLFARGLRKSPVHSLDSGAPIATRTWPPHPPFPASPSSPLSHPSTS